MDEKKNEQPESTDEQEPADESVDADVEASEEIVDDKAAIELWRFRETGRFEARDEIFQGFESPPGRF
jgi:hypothetical protein